MVHFLKTSQCPLDLDKAKHRYYRLQSIPYVLINDVLYRKDHSGVLLRCVDSDQIGEILHEFHDGHSGGHFSPRTIAFKIMQVGYYWPNVFKDSHAYVRKCVKCALFAGKERLAALPLQPIKTKQPFVRWGVDFIGPINPPSSVGHKWIITATDYFTRWSEAAALKDANETAVLNFYDDIIHRFGIPDSIISDNALAFISLRVTKWVPKHGIYLSNSSNYYLQGNKLAESTNKNLIRILKRNLQENQHEWHSKLKAALWVDRITPKKIIDNSPCMIVYGKEAKLSISTELPALDLASQLVLFEEGDPMQVCYAQLMELEEKRSKAIQAMEYQQIQVKKSFEKRARARDFNVGDVVLKWDELKSRSGKHTKFDSFWGGPFVILECKEHNAYQLSTMEGDILSIPVNGIHLKRYFKV